MVIGTGAEESRGIQMIDWVAAPEPAGAGVALMRKLAAQFDFIYSLGGSEITRSILPRCGFVEHVQVWRAARPLRPFAQIRTHQYRNYKLLPRLIRNWFWAR